MNSLNSSNISMIFDTCYWNGTPFPVVIKGQKKLIRNVVEYVLSTEGKYKDLISNKEFIKKIKVTLNLLESILRYVADKAGLSLGGDWKKIEKEYSDKIKKMKLIDLSFIPDILIDTYKERDDDDYNVIINLYWTYSITVLEKLGKIEINDFFGWLDMPNEI